MERLIDDRLATEFGTERSDGLVISAVKIMFTVGEDDMTIDTKS